MNSDCTPYFIGEWRNAINKFFLPLFVLDIINKLDHIYSSSINPVKLWNYHTIPNGIIVNKGVFTEALYSGFENEIKFDQIRDYLQIFYVKHNGSLHIAIPYEPTTHGFNRTLLTYLKQRKLINDHQIQNLQRYFTILDS